MFIERISEKVGAIFESSPVSRSMIIPLFLLFVMTQYISFNLICLMRPVAYLNNVMLERTLFFEAVVSTISIIMVLLRHRLEQSELAQNVVPYVFTLFYMFSLMTLGYSIGHMSIVAGVVIAAAPLMSIILFEGAVTAILIIFGVIYFVIISILDGAGILPYAPLFTFQGAPDDAAKTFFWWVMIFLMLPYLVSFMAGMYFIVAYWRSREENIRRMGLVDSLTEMANRRAIHDYLAHVVALRKEAELISIILVDVDHFKRVNDSYGHAMGDLVLRRVGDSLKVSVRASDQVGRYGGEEFLIVLPNTSLESASQIAERCRVHIENEVILSPEEQPIRVTASFGVYCSTVHSDEISHIVKYADLQLYRAKAEGRNRVCAHNEDTMSKIENVIS